MFINNGDGLFTISRPLDSQSDTIYSTELADFDYSYIKYELKNGETISYEFGDAKANDVDAMSKEFFDWFESLPPYSDIKNPTRPSLEEEKCVKEFYEKHIMDKKDQKTDTILINE